VYRKLVNGKFDVMKNRTSQSSPVPVIVLVLLLSLAWPGAAQNVAQQEELSEELSALVRSKWETIELESKGSKEEWDGVYRSFDGPTVTTHVAWSHRSGFIAWWENCSRPWLARVNYGRAELANGSLKIIPQLSENSPGSFPIASEYVTVRWGSQHFLVPSDKMIQFVYAVNSGSVSEVESFLMKIEDYAKERKGLANVPPAYARYLGMKPITGVISGFGPKVEKWYSKVILNVGKVEGVVPAMKFYVSRPGKHFMVLEVISVQEHTSEASVVLASQKSNGKEIEAKVGWTVSSRAPKDSWQFMPY
jgi:hypothetical protein